MNPKPIKCVARNTTDQVDNQVLYFVFDKRVFLEANHSPVVTIRVMDPGVTIKFPYTTSLDQSLQFNQTGLNGSLDISALTSFSIATAFNDLVVTNILKDPWLLVAMSVVTAFVVILIGMLISRSQTALT